MEQGGDARPVKIHVEKAHLFSLHGERDGQVGGDGAFTDPALAGKDHDFMADPGHPLLDGVLVRSFFFGSGIALVCAITRIAVIAVVIVAH